ncbi:MAG: TFIIB-type zinc ribbon-containing protein [Acidobacteriota bacterium]
MASSPFTIKEIGPPGAQRAVADFTCPKCGQFSRFTVRDETPDGGFICPHCGLEVEIRGTRLSDYQDHLDAIDGGLRDFAGRIRDKATRAASDLADGAAEEESPASDKGDPDAAN